MASLLRREPRMEHLDALERLDRTLGDWMRAFSPPHHMASTREWTPADLVQVDEFYEDGIVVIRAELPGLDPDEDVDLTIVDGLLRIQAERRQEEEREERGYVRKELRYGSFARSLPLPEGVTEADISATYKDGMLEIRVPAPQPEPAKRIAVDKG